MKKIMLIVAAGVFTSSAMGALDTDVSVFTLYRNSVTDVNMRLHIATFDVAEDESYNRNNCELAASLFQKQSGVKTKFWCEQGRFKK